MTSHAVQLGLPYLLQLTATLSVSLAVINLLPIPALDGGHLLFLAIEAIRRKRVSLEFQERMTQVGFALLMALMIFIIYNDLVNINAFEKIRSLFQPQTSDQGPVTQK
jgi:regulator of sigma E protease